MTYLPLAFSIHHFINSVGADAGFAAIIGLAILILLYFAQARETSTLRDRADAAELRAGDLEARLAQVARAAQSPVLRPAPAPAARPLINPVAARAVAPAAAVPAAAVPAAPAGVGAPALAAATRLIPAPVPPSPVAPVTTPAVAAAATSTEPPDAQPAVAAGPPPATAAAAVALAGNGAGNDTGGGSPGPATAVATPPPPQAAPPDAPTSEDQAPFAAPEPLPRGQLRPPAAAPPARPGPAAPRRGTAASAPRRPSRVGRGVAVGLTLLGVIAVVAVLLIATSGSGNQAPSASTQTTNAPSKHHKAKGRPFDTSAVTVAVLNGTSTSGLAARVSQQLGSRGYKQGPTTNAADQTQTTTSVFYLPGHRADAVAVAKSLRLPTSVVTPVDSGTQAIACQGASACTVDVVVTLGADLASR